MAGGDASAAAEGFRSGMDLAKPAIDAYFQARAYRDKLKLAAQEHQEKAAALQTEDSRYRDKLKLEQEKLEVEKDRWSNEAGLRESTRRLNEDEAANLEKGLNKQGGNPDKQTRSAADHSIMTQAQAAAAAARIDSQFSKTGAGPISENLFNLREHYRSLANPSYKPETYKAPPVGGWKGFTNALKNAFVPGAAATDENAAANSYLGQ